MLVTRYYRPAASLRHVSEFLIRQLPVTVGHGYTFIRYARTLASGASWARLVARGPGAVGLAGNPRVVAAGARIRRDLPARWTLPKGPQSKCLRVSEYGVFRHRQRVSNKSNNSVKRSIERFIARLFVVIGNLYTELLFDFDEQLSQVKIGRDFVGDVLGVDLGHIQLVPVDFSHANGNAFWNGRVLVESFDEGVVI